MIRGADEWVAGRLASEIVASLPDRLSRPALEWAVKTPDAPALVELGKTWTYGQLAQAVEHTKALLQRLGVGPGDRIMVINENCRALVALLLAASELDVWVTVVNARIAASEVDHIADHCVPRRIFYTVEISPEAAAHGARHGAETVDDPWLGRIAIGPLNAESRPEPVKASGAEQVAALIYTSGTTGLPKGVMLSHRGVLFVGAISAGLRRVGPGTRVYGVLPFSHIFGFASVLLGTFYHGACVHLAARFDPAEVYRALAEDGISIFQGVPAMFAKLIEYMETRGLPLKAPALRFISVGGAPLDPALKQKAEAVFGLTMNNGYGLTENSPTASQTRIEEPRSDCSTGKILPLLEAKTVDAEGRDVGFGEIGELWLRGPTVMLGYYKNPQATREVLSEDGWLNTGDLAVLDADGYLAIVGRTKELIIRSGFNVYPPDVEAVLNEHPQITLSAVVGRAVPGNEEVIAFVQPVPGAAITEEEVKRFAAERLAPYKRPSRVIIMDALPATATGKILKGKLKEAAKALPGGA